MWSCLLFVALISSPALKRLHWLPVDSRLFFRINYYFVLLFRINLYSVSPLDICRRGLIKSMMMMMMRVEFKNSSLAIKTLQNGQPRYLSDLIIWYRPTWSLHSADKQWVVVPDIRSESVDVEILLE